MGNGSTTGFSIRVSLFILVENEGNFVKWHRHRMVSGVCPFQKVRHSSQKSSRLSTALLGNIIVLISLMGKLRPRDGHMPKVTELWEVGRRTARRVWIGSHVPESLCAANHFICPAVLGGQNQMTGLVKMCVSFSRS